MRLSFICLFFIGALLSAQTRTGSAAESGNLPIQRIGANDLVAVSVYDSAELTRTVRVGPEGFLRLPLLKRRIEAAGLLPSELELAITSALKEEGLLVDPFVTVMLAEYTSRPISVVGAVKHPLTFQASSPVTLLEALARAEGLAPNAGSELLLSRTAGGQQLLQRIAVKKLIDGADPAVNLKLEGGEEIRVPEAGRIFVVGNVKKPGSFEVPDDGPYTIMQALAQAEGLLPYSGRQAYVYRREASGKKNEITVELRQILRRKATDVTLLPNDILYVPDAKGTRVGLAALEKIVMFGSGATSALIYAGVR